jgi:mRNA interferase RelE/StbE
VPDEYELQLDRSAKRELERLPERDYQRIARMIDQLATEPRPKGALKLRSSVPLYRLRSGNYRLIYAVFDDERLVKITDVVRRTTQTYRGLES